MIQMQKESFTIPKDIFISYRNDGCSNQFAHRRANDLTELGYSVYFNPYEERSNSFPDRLKNAVKACKDFIMVISPASMERLMRNDILRAAPYSAYAKSQKAYHLREGLGCTFFLEKYLQFLKEEMPDGDNMTALGLANLLLPGRGYEPDTNKAYELYERAYRHGIHYAATMMRRIEGLKPER